VAAASRVTRSTTRLALLAPSHSGSPPSPDDLACWFQTFAEEAQKSAAAAALFLAAAVTES
jgi:hypothetical protein